MTAPEQVEYLAVWLEKFTEKTHPGQDAARTLRALSAALEAEKARAEAAEAARDKLRMRTANQSRLLDAAEAERDALRAKLDALTAPVSYAETDEHMQNIQTGVSWLDQPLSAAKSVQAIINARIARHQKETDT